MWKKYKSYIISILIALAAGGLSAFLTRNNMNIYDTIKTPPLSPPGWLFPVVWSILYILMGIGAARVYETGKNENKDVSYSLKIYALQLAVNFFWSVIFFNIQVYLASFIWLVLLWILIVKMIKEFNKTDKLAANLQIPYLLWVTFAGYLNFMIWMLNK